MTANAFGERPMTPERAELLARTRARRLAAGMQLEDLPTCEAGKMVAACVPKHLEAELAKRAAKEVAE